MNFNKVVLISICLLIFVVGISCASAADNFNKDGTITACDGIDQIHGIDADGLQTYNHDSTNLVKDLNCDNAKDLTYDNEIVFDNYYIGDDNYANHCPEVVGHDSDNYVNYYFGSAELADHNSGSDNYANYYFDAANKYCPEGVNDATLVI